MHLRQILTLAGIAASVLLATPSAIAQQTGGGQERPGRGNFDPEQMRQRMMERYREVLDIKGDDEWKIIEERVNKVNEARRDAGSGRGGFGMMRPQRQGGGNDGQEGARANRGGGPGGFGGSQLPEAEELQKAIDAKASAEEIKTKLAKYRDARKAKQANLAKAQDELRKVLSVRQEAAAVLMGLLD
ncbi:MAG: hypothetical protein IT580_03265 [Verrucomicrobiales bacterium]|nr:hypothetical protein [Verrucomicrobiales bacterium]